MDISQFNYDLPEELIAQSPVMHRTQSRLLEVGDDLVDLNFTDILQLINPNDLLITNNTKVMAARLHGKKPTGGKVEILLERILDENHALAQIKSSKSVKAGQMINIGHDDVLATVISPSDEFWKLKFHNMPVAQVIEKHGVLPLPPYIKRNAQQKDDRRYQTIYAKRIGAVAAPTAGLHFDNKLLEKIEAKGVRRCELTLHVGAGTFKPVRVQHIAEHKMHNEYYQIDDDVIHAIKKTQNQGGRIIAVGTTTVRALESAYLHNKLIESSSGLTDIFIYPGFNFSVVDAMITNFHLPKSTLLMMVSAFAGYKRIMDAYEHAINQRYRFFSYGDAMFLHRIDINRC